MQWLSFSRSSGQIRAVCSMHCSTTGKTGVKVQPVNALHGACCAVVYGREVSVSAMAAPRSPHRCTSSWLSARAIKANSLEGLLREIEDGFTPQEIRLIGWRSPPVNGHVYCQVVGARVVGLKLDATNDALAAVHC